MQNDQSIPPSLAEAFARCRQLGLHPADHPLGDSHHTEVPYSNEDKEIGNALAYFLGTLFSDVDGKDSRYWYYERTSVDEWTRVARALRVHGLSIADRPDDAIEGDTCSPGSRSLLTD
jgi:hypothetical protein